MVLRTNNRFQSKSKSNEQPKMRLIFVRKKLKTVRTVHVSCYIGYAQINKMTQAERIIETVGAQNNMIAFCLTIEYQCNNMISRFDQSVRVGADETQFIFASLNTVLRVSGLTVCSNRFCCPGKSDPFPVWVHIPSGQKEKDSAVHS